MRFLVLVCLVGLTSAGCSGSKSPDSPSDGPSSEVAGPTRAAGSDEASVELSTVPVIGTCIAMIIMSFLQKVRWIWRALIPASVFVVLAVLQRLTWEEYVLPLLVAPPS